MRTALAKTVRQALRAHQNPARAKQQQAYMKSDMPHYGIQAAPLRSMLKATFKEQPCTSNDAWVAAIEDLWRNARYREERYAGIELFAFRKYQRAWLGLQHYPLLREMIETGAWWDYVDNLAANHTYQLLQSHPQQTTQLMRTWSREHDLWLRRTSIICQLKRRTDTDLALLTYAIEGSLGDKDFFARKAIGWALREYSKTDPDWVVRYVNDQADNLSPLSVREALKIVNKPQGRNK